MSIFSSSSSGPRPVEVNGGAGVVDTPDHNAITSSEKEIVIEGCDCENQ